MTVTPRPLSSRIRDLRARGSSLFALAPQPGDQVPDDRRVQCDQDDFGDAKAACKLVEFDRDKEGSGALFWRLHELGCG